MSNESLSKSAKRVLKLALERIDDLPIEEKLTLWDGIAELTPESSHIGAAARHNRMLIEESMKQQETFLNLLA